MQSNKTILVFLFLVLLSFFSCNLQDVSQRSAAGLMFRVPDKHRTCDICHNSTHPVKGSELFASGVDPSARCLNIDCHRNYDSNHHPVDFVPVSSEFVSPGVEFPLFEGKIRCLTCHDPHAGPGYTETPKFLRGGYPLDIPYVDRRRLCFKCHFKEKYADINPHAMLDNEGRHIQINGKSVCLLCHKVVPDPLIHRRSDVRFKADVAFICMRCHPPMPGEFFAQHFLLTPSKKVMDHIDRSEKSMNVIFPLVPRSRMTCSTCHNPHQKEVMRNDRARTGAGEPNRLRLKSSMICLGCHSVK